MLRSDKGRKYLIGSSTYFKSFAAISNLQMLSLSKIQTIMDNSSGFGLFFEWIGLPSLNPMQNQMLDLKFLVSTEFGEEEDLE